MSKEEIKTFEDVWAFVWDFLYTIIKKFFPKWKNIIVEPDDAE